MTATAPDLSRYQQGMNFWCSACHKFFGELIPGGGQFHREDDDYDRCPWCFGSDEDCIELTRDGVDFMCHRCADAKEAHTRHVYRQAIFALLDENMHFGEG